MIPFDQYWQEKRAANKEALKLEPGKPCLIDPSGSIELNTAKATTTYRIPLFARGKNWGVFAKLDRDGFVRGRLSSCDSDGKNPQIHGTFEVDKPLFDDLVQNSDSDLILVDRLLRRIAEEGGQPQ